MKRLSQVMRQMMVCLSIGIIHSYRTSDKNKESVGGSFTWSLKSLIWYVILLYSLEFNKLPTPCIVTCLQQLDLKSINKKMKNNQEPIKISQAGAWMNNAY